MRRRFVLKYDYLVIAGLETVWRRYQPHHVPRTAGADEFLHVAVSQRRRRRTADHHLQVFVNAGRGQCEGIPGRVPWISDVRRVQWLQQSTECKTDCLLGPYTQISERRDPKGKQLDYTQASVQGVMYVNRLFELEDKIRRKYAGNYEAIRQA